MRLAINLILALLFVAALAGVAWGMFAMRRSALATYGSAESQADWDRWREDIAKEAKSFDAPKEGNSAEPSATSPPVKRRVPKATEPPALILMRDRFATCLIAALVLSGAMFGSILLLIRGTLLSGGAPKDDLESEPSL